MTPTAPRVLALVQARLGSSRLPGKSRLPCPPNHVAEDSLFRTSRSQGKRQAPSVGNVLVATTTQPLDDELATLATALGAGVFRGDEHDVLGRFAGALAQAGPTDVVVRLTADNPAIDPAFLEAAVAYHLSTGADYTHTTGLPLGTNLEILSAEALRRAHAQATQPDEREHVTPYLRRHPELFRLTTLPLAVAPTVAALRLTVDYPSDYAFVSMLFSALGPNFSLTDPSGLPALLDRHPWLADINAGNVQR